MKTRVYLVDEHVLVRRGLIAMIRAHPDLELCGEASDGATATREVRALRPDVVVAEISLRDVNGFELIRNIREFDSEIQIVVLSMHREADYAMAVLKAGAKAYVMKQDDAGNVIDAIRKARNGQIFVSERVASQLLERAVTGKDAEADSPVAKLSPRELEVFTLIGSGFSTREIASRLQMGMKTVETHREHIKEKIHLLNGFDLLLFSIRWVDQSNMLPA